MEEEISQFFKKEEIKKIIHDLLLKYECVSHEEKVFEILDELASGNESLDELLFLLEEKFEDLIDAEKIVGLKNDLYDQVIYPIKVELQHAFESKKKPLKEIVETIKKNNTLSFSEPRLEERFAFIAERFFREEYDEERTLRALTKGIKPGGLELTEDSAKKVLDDMRPMLGRVRFVDDVKNVIPIYSNVIPAKAGIHEKNVGLDPRIRGDDMKRSGDDTGKELPIQQGQVLPVPHALIDTKEELVKKNEELGATRLVAALTPSYSRVKPPQSKEEKQRSATRAQAQTISYTNTRVATIPLPRAVPQTVKIVTPVVSHTHGALCDIVNAVEIEELLKAQETAEMHAKETQGAHDDFKEIFTEILKENTVALASPDLCDRLYGIIVTRLKEIRSAYEVRDLIVKKSEAGGLGFSSVDAEKFIRLLEEKRELLNKRIESRVTHQKQEYLERQRENLFKTPDDTTPVATIPTSIKTTDIVGVKSAIPSAMPKTTIAPHLKQARPVLQDVMRHPEAPLLDPVSELKSYTIEDFHRLHRDPKEAALKIENKIHYLSEWSFAKRYKGIEAWKASEVCHVYREQLQQSVIGNMPLMQVIERRKAAGQLFLTIEEVGSLTELNNRLHK